MKFSQFYCCWQRFWIVWKFNPLFLLKHFVNALIVEYDFLGTRIWYVQGRGVSIVICNSIKMVLFWFWLCVLFQSRLTNISQFKNLPNYYFFISVIFGMNVQDNKKGQKWSLRFLTFPWIIGVKVIRSKSWLEIVSTRFI